MPFRFEKDLVWFSWDLGLGLNTSLPNSLSGAYTTSASFLRLLSFSEFGLPIYLLAPCTMTESIMLSLGVIMIHN